MKKFFKEFKAFISRGNIIDMAGGVIIGSAFSAIVTSLTNKIIMPLINALLALIGGNGLESARTILGEVVYKTAGDPTSGIDWASTVYIDWGAFITAIIDFLLIALVLFTILKIVMKSSQILRDASTAAKKNRLTKEQRHELKTLGIDRKNKEAVALYLEGKKQEEERLKAEAEAKAKADEEEKMRNTSEYLLKEIRDLLKENAALKAEKTETEETK